MERDRRKYNVSKILSALLLIMALLWLTISLPFVYSSQQELAKQNKAINDGSSRCNSEEEAASCFGNTTEEKAPSSSSSISEEYLPDNHISEYFMSIASQFYKCENIGIYNAFHGEVHVPPPNLS